MRALLLLFVMTACDSAPSLPDDDAIDVDEASDCAAIAPLDFRDHVLVPILEDGGCIVCHRDGGRAGGSDLVLVGGDEDAAVAVDLASAERVAKKTVDGESVLLLRPTGRYPDGHPGGEPIALGSPAYDALARFVSAARSCTPDGHAPIGGARP